MREELHDHAPAHADALGWADVDVREQVLVVSTPTAQGLKSRVGQVGDLAQGQEFILLCLR